MTPRALLFDDVRIAELDLTAAQIRHSESTTREQAEVTLDAMQQAEDALADANDALAAWDRDHDVTAGTTAADAFRGIAVQAGERR